MGDDVSPGLSPKRFPGLVQAARRDTLREYEFRARDRLPQLR